MVILGKDGKEYKTVKECLVADKAYDEAVAEKQLEKERAEKSVSARKKELSNAITKAEQDRVAAIQEYEIASQKADQLVAEAHKAAKEMLLEAKKKVSAAVEAKTEAVLAFNKEFGAYKVVLTGNEALNEYNRIVKEFNKDFFSRIFW